MENVKRIVVIDDETELLDIIALLLKKINIDTTTFSDGRTAIDFIKSSPPNVILVDLAMPNLNGIEVINYIREFSKEIPIVAMSGMEWKETLLEGARIAGANKILNKPFDSSELYKTIADYIKD